MQKLDKEEKPVEQGRYIYCVAENNGSKPISFGKIGIENSEVYIIPYENLCAVVHNCAAEPYKSGNEKEVKKWIVTHQNVIDAASKRLGTLIPLSFDVIIKGTNPDENVVNWLKDESESLRSRIDKIKDKQEFGVQVYWDKKVIGNEIAKKTEVIKRLKKQMEEATRGKAYFYEQEIKQLLKKEMEKTADELFKKFYSQIKKHADDIRVEKVKKDGEKETLLNLSCLMNKDNVKKLGAELEEINKIRGFSVRFTGPWPCYSFVG